MFQNPSLFADQICLPTIFKNYDGNPPEIDIKKENITLQTGVSQNLTCKSNEPIMWANYTRMYNWVPPIETIEFNRTANLYNETRAVLTLENVSTKMVGMYYCVKKQSYYDSRHLTLDRLVKMNQASRIYIYVNDPAHPLVPIDGIVFKVYRGDFFESPCKATLPNMDVEFYRINEGDGTQLSNTTKTNIRFGPLKVVPTKSAEYMFTMSRGMIIDKTTQRETGTYWCIVEDQNGNKKFKKFILYVNESSGNFVMLRKDNNLSVINVRRNADGITPPINIVFTYLSYPAIITYYWLNDRGQKIIAGHNGKYELSHTDTHVKLRINEPKVFDTGIYTVFVTAGNAARSLRMEVYVYAKPIVQMQSKFVKTGEQVSFLCRSIGFPRPEIFFMFQPCSNKPKWTNCFSQAPIASDWDSSSSDIVSEPSARRSPRGKPEIKIAMSRVLPHIATRPGVMYCRATNSEGSEVTQADLLVSDLPDAITMKIAHPKETITVGDNVTVVCSALVYNYTNDITFTRKGINMTEVCTKYSKELYAEQARFTIESIQHEDGGMYSCQVKTIYDTYETRDLHLQVLDPVRPILKSGKSNKTLVVELTSPLRLKCDVIGTPDPKIIWLKDGNKVVPENVSNHVQLNRTTLTFEFLREEDLGIYECRAENKMGSIYKYWKVLEREVEVRKLEEALRTMK
uniref:Ig-like domain-containing protein n=1 Tax=Anopheles dirus TaxID=7168 RepID=A0A182NA30_9DIPT